MLLLTVKLGKHIRFVTFLFHTIDETPSFFQTWILARGQNTRMLITFFCSEPPLQFDNESCKFRAHVFLILKSYLISF